MAGSDLNPDGLIKLAFVSSKEELAPALIERMNALFPELPLWVVSEFPPPEGKWIPYKPFRTFGENLARIRAVIGGRKIRLSAVVLEPKSPYWPMRWMAFLLAPLGFIAFNESFDNFMLRPRSLPVIARHFLWRLKAFLRFELRPGGTWYTWAWRVRHPKALRRPANYWAARLAGFVANQVRRLRPAQADPAPRPRPAGLTVVIPTRNGKDLVARLLPGVLAQMPDDSEIIVVDNGSDDGTAGWLSEQYPQIRTEVSGEPLSFAAAVNRGIRAARYSHVCLLNNDMIVEPDFFAPLRRAFDEVPELFCATAQILFPEGMRRQETGKAVWWGKEAGRTARDFPVRCIEPFEGEDQTYVLYGSGGCSLYDAAKLEQIGGFEERLAPAYVEDLDLGWRGWQRNWPTVYVGAARVTHFHRSTTTRYYKPELLQSFVEYNFLRFLARHVNDPRVFPQLWRDALERLNLLAVDQPWFTKWPEEALVFAWKATRLLAPAPACEGWDEELTLGIGSGGVAVFPGPMRRGKPRVLVVSPYIPYPLSHGGAVRIFNLMRCAAEEFDQVLVAFVDELGSVPQPLLDLCAEVVLVKRYGTHVFADRGRPDVVEEFHSSTMQGVLRQTVRKWRPGVAQLEFTQMAQYAGDCAPAKTIVVEHDVTFDLQEQLLRTGEDWETRRQYERWLRFEKQAWRDVDSVVVMSERDQRTVASDVGAGKVTCLANGVDLERFQTTGRQPDPRRLLFIGAFQHLPNMMALDWFLRQAWPLLEDLQPVLHIIAGNRHTYFQERYKDSVTLDLARAGMEVEGFVSDVRPAYEQAAVVIAPLVASAGTNIKIMEAMAMRKAIVSTPAGINGLDLTDGQDVLVATTPAEFAAAIRRLLTNPGEREAIEEKARITVERDFDWKAIGRRQAALFDSLRR